MSEEERVRHLYIDLLIKCISGVIYKDPNIAPWLPAQFNPSSRHIGQDWPLIAHSMVGTLRLKNVASLVETLIRENIPGDLIETGVWRGGCCILMRGVLKLLKIIDANTE